MQACSCVHSEVQVLIDDALFNTNETTTGGAVDHGCLTWHVQAHQVENQNMESKS